MLFHLLFSGYFGHLKFPKPRDWRDFCDILARVPFALCTRIARASAYLDRDECTWAAKFTEDECVALMAHLEATAEYLYKRMWHQLSNAEKESCCLALGFSSEIFQ
jgi:hypothetical protein